MEKCIDRKSLQFGESVKLSDLPTRKIILAGDDSARAVDYKDFFIEEINCSGSLSLPAYDLYMPHNYPARLLGQALELELSQAYWNYMTQTRTSPWLAFALFLEIDPDEWQNFCQEIGRKNPLSCCLIIPDGKSRLQYYANLDITIFRNDVLSKGAITWSQPEESREMKNLRWSKALKTDNHSWTEELGEVLLTHNYPDLINEMQFKCVPFGGRF